MRIPLKNARIKVDDLVGAAEMRYQHVGHDPTYSCHFDRLWRFRGSGYYLYCATAVRRYERWAGRPISDGMSIDDEGHIYLGDLARKTIGVFGSDRRYRQLIADPALSWIDAFNFGLDGQLYAVANQLHRTAALNTGNAATEPPYRVVRIKPLATGTTGR